MKLTLHEIAQCLFLPISTVRRWIRQGRIPIHKSGGDYVFNEFILKQWAAAHNLSFSPPGKGARQPKTLEPENLLSAMKRGGVFHDVRGDDVRTALQSAVETLPTLAESFKKKLYQQLLEREHLASTGIGKGVAIPHPKTCLDDDNFRPAITTCFLEKPVDFSALDRKPVFVMFILLCPSVKYHLHLLSRLAFCVRDDSFVEFLRKLPGPDALFSKIAEFEEQLDKSRNV